MLGKLVCGTLSVWDNNCGTLVSGDNCEVCLLMCEDMMCGDLVWDHWLDGTWSLCGGTECGTLVYGTLVGGTDVWT